MLRLVREDAPPDAVSLKVQSPVRGVVLIDALLDDQDVPLHWRAGDWSKPPLDIWFDAAGRLAGLQFVLQDEVLVEKAGRPQRSRPTRDSWPVFDAVRWPSDRYLDEKVAVSFWRADDVLVLEIGAPDSYEWRRVAEGLYYGVDRDHGIAALAIGPLSDSDWQAIEMSSNGS